MDFCKAYNATTESQRGTVIPAEITIYEDRSFTFITKTPPTPVLLRQAAGIEKGSTTRAASKLRSHPGPDPRDRRGEDARRERDRHRGRHAPSGGHRPLDGHRRRRLVVRDSPPAGPRSAITGTPRELERSEPWQARSTPTRRRSTTRPSCTSRRGVRAGEVARQPQFDETVEVAFKLGVDPRKADQMLPQHRLAAGRYRQGRAGRGVRRGRRGPGGA